MLHASSSKSLGRTLTIGGLLLAGLFCLIELSPAQTAKDKDKNKGTVGKGQTTSPKTTAQPSLKMTIVSEGSDVAEMKKVIDEKIKAGWDANKVTPSGYCDDYEFIRRVSLDVVGRVAKPDEIEYFFEKYDKKTKKAVTNEERRSRYIEYLLKHEDYARHWANLWSNWLLTRSGDFGRGKYHEQMQTWLEDQFAQNKKYNEIARAVLTAKGNNKDNGAANFILAHLGEAVPADKRKEEGQWEMIPLTSRITRVFLGLQTQCAQCHPHPFFPSLKQEMFWGVNAFLRQVQREPGPMRQQQRNMQRPDLTLKDDENTNPDANVFFELRNGKVKMWRAEFLPSGGKERGPRLDPKKVGIARRETLAEHLVDHEMFGKAMVNRMWGLFMGRGFVNPIDDFNDNNQPSDIHKELLTELASRFKHYNYDFKKLIRWITHSNAYHLSHVANSTNDKVDHETLFARMVMKAMSPEQMFESLMVATNAEAADQGNAAAKKKLRDEWLGALINNFGDDEGNEVTFNGTIVQALMMMNGKQINDAISRDKKGTVAMAMSSGSRNSAAIITKLYLAALNRRPTPAELKAVQLNMQLRSGFATKDSDKAKYEDLFWALLNSNEFILNH